MCALPSSDNYPFFDRDLLESGEDFSVVGGGQLGGKSLGLAMARRIIADACPPGAIEGIEVAIPRLTVLRTELFEQFMAQNDLYEIALGNLSDERIAHAFVKAELPPLLVGDLHALIAKVRTPLAVRSSSLMEDALHHPFAGVYATKMIPNNQATVRERFKKLTDAVKLIWASTFFGDAKRYMSAIDQPIQDERMAVVIQEVVGERFNERFYPIVSGVIRTYNCYPTGASRAEDGVVNLALGLGKSIVDGGVTWVYNPRFPGRPPPVGSVRDMITNTQSRFWAINMAPASFDPINEAEHLVQMGLDIAEWDDVLRFTASTYDGASNRLVIGTAAEGPRVLTFSRILELGDVPLNDVVRRLSNACKSATQSDVEIEFALTLDRRHGLPARFGFLQMRPMMTDSSSVTVDEAELTSDRTLVASESVLGNGRDDTVMDIIYVKPAAFDAKHTPAIAKEIESLNAELQSAGRRYLLIGFGRWGSSDPWLGIPVTWPQLSGARVIVEATLPEINVDASQGSHFFHNMISFQVLYFMVHHDEQYAIGWDWLDRRPASIETRFLRHVRLESPLEIRVDGRRKRGVILHR